MPLLPQPVLSLLWPQPHPAFGGQDSGPPTWSTASAFGCVQGLLYRGQLDERPFQEARTPDSTAPDQRRTLTSCGPRHTSVQVLGDLLWRRRALPFFFPWVWKSSYWGWGANPRTTPKQRDGRVTAQGQEDEQFGWNQDSDPPPFDSSRCDLYSNTDFPPHLVTLKICKEESGKKPAFEGTCRSNPCCSRVSCKQEANPLGPEHHLKETSIFFDVSLRCSFWLCWKLLFFWLRNVYVWLLGSGRLRPNGF